MHYGSLVKTASAFSEAEEIMSNIYNENPSHWPNGLTSKHFDGGLYLVRKSASHVPVGFVGWQEREEGMDKVGYYSIGILPEHRRRGFAKEAITKILSEKAAGVDVVKALISHTNKPSIELAKNIDGVETQITKAAAKKEKEKLSTRSKDLRSKLLALVERYSKPRPWYHFGFGSDRVPGRDIVGQEMDEDYFKRRGKPTSGLLMRGPGPDHFGLYPNIIDDEMGTMYSEDPNKPRSKKAHVKESTRDPGKLVRLLQRIFGAPRAEALASGAGRLRDSGALHRLGGAGGGFGTAAAENEYIIPDADPAIHKINLLLGTLTGGSAGSKMFKNRFVSEAKDRQSLLGALNRSGWTYKQLGLLGTMGMQNLSADAGSLAESMQKYTDEAGEHAATNLDAAKARLAAEKERLKGNWWKDTKDWFGENPKTAWGVTSALGGSLLGAYLYNALKKPNKAKPGVMTVEIPEGEVRDRFYTNLSRNMLFKDPKKKPKKAIPGGEEQLALENKPTKAKA